MGREREIIGEVVPKVYQSIRTYYERRGPIYDFKEDQEIDNGFNYFFIDKIQLSFSLFKTVKETVEKTEKLIKQFNLPLVALPTKSNLQNISKIILNSGYKNNEGHECYIISVDTQYPISGLTLFKKFEHACPRSVDEKCGEEESCATWVFGGDADLNFIFSGKIKREFNSDKKQPKVEECGIIPSNLYRPREFINNIDNLKKQIDPSDEELKKSLEFAELLARAVDHTFKDYPDLYEL